MVELSVIVATYNRPAFLLATLHALGRQRNAPPFEVVVADDGSDDRTCRAIAGMQADYPVPLLHSWHPDDGFRLAEARNRAVAASRGRFLVFLDDDCVARTSLLRRYAQFLRQGRLVFGERVLLSERLTRSVLDTGKSPGDWQFAEWLLHWRAGDVNRIARLIALPLGPMRRLLRDEWSAAEGCNVGMARHDFEAVNGYDNGYRGWGCEDWDLAVRLHRSGVQMYDGRFALAVAHLWHPEADKGRVSVNRSRLDRCIAGNGRRADNGMAQVRGDSFEAVRAG